MIETIDTITEKADLAEIATVSSVQKRIASPATSLHDTFAKRPKATKSSHCPNHSSLEEGIQNECMECIQFIKKEPTEPQQQIPLYFSGQVETVVLYCEKHNILKPNCPECMEYR